MTAGATLTFSMPESDIGVISLDMPGKGANILSSSVLDELSALLDELERRTDLAGVIVRSHKPGVFIAGADLREFVASLGAEKSAIAAVCRRGQELFRRLSRAPFVTVAAIHGVCLGGGAELAIWCDRRVFSRDARTEFGFPEVKLGLFPGWGGTARAPRVVGLANAVELITGGESVDAVTAAALGLADDLVPPDDLLNAAIGLVRDARSSRQYLEDRQRWSRPVGVSETELGFLGVTASALIRQTTRGHYPAPEAALELMLETAQLDVDGACQREAEGMAQLFGSPVNAALLNVFFLQDRAKRDPGVTAKDVPPREIRSVSVLGAGIMGSGIAAANIKRELPVVLYDAAAEALLKGSRGILEEVAYDKKSKGPNAARAIQHAALLNATSTDAEIAAADLVIEAIVENQEAKQKVYARIEPLLRDDAILASNTSTIPISHLAERLLHPERFCGIHFFNPVRRMKLVEVVRGRKSSDETIATAVAYSKKIGKVPIVVNDGPGFLVNRLLFPYMNEAIELLCEGASIQEIDRAATSFGMPMGPIELYDMVGLDTALYAGRTLWEAYPDRVAASPLLPALVKAGRLGQKSGAGFFSHRTRKGRPAPDPEFDKLLQPYLRGKRKFEKQELTARLFLPMLLEATRALEDGIVRDPRDVDLGLILGLGFPPFQGGLLFWADRQGAARILEMLKPFEACGARLQPTPSLVDMARSGRTFYGRPA